MGSQRFCPVLQTLVPRAISDAGGTASGSLAGVGKDGFGAAGTRVGADNLPDGSASSTPPLSEQRAWQIAGLAEADRGTAELVWMLVNPRSGFLATEFRPLWRLTSRSGTVVYVTSDGELMSAAQLDALR